MPWCEDCSRFLNPNTLESDGSCPSCGTKVAEPPAEAEAKVGEQRYKAPWHFKLLVAVTVLYLGWRLIQLAWRLVEVLT